KCWTATSRSATTMPTWYTGVDVAVGSCGSAGRLVTGVGPLRSAWGSSGDDAPDDPHRVAQDLPTPMRVRSGMPLLKPTIVSRPITFDVEAQPCLPRHSGTYSSLLAMYSNTFL